MLHKYVIEMCENLGIVVGVDVRYIKQKRAVSPFLCASNYVGSQNVSLENVRWVSHLAL
jgi:hypothetical protein